MAQITFYVNVTVQKTGVAVAVKTFGIPMFLSLHTRTTNRADVYADTTEMGLDGFIAGDPAFDWATTVKAQSPNVDSFIIGRKVGAESITDSYNAVRDENDDWYFVNIEDRTDQEILDIATATEPVEKIFIAQSLDPDVLTSTAGNIALQLNVLARKRTALLWHGLDSEFGDGAWTGIGAAYDLDAEGGVRTWANQTLGGVTVNDLKLDSEVNAIRDQDANVYHKVTEVNNFTTSGQVSNPGDNWIDVQTTLDWTFFRVQESVLQALLSAPGGTVGYSQSGIDRFVNATLDVLNRGATNGHYSQEPDEVPTATGPRIRDISTTTRTTRKLSGVQGRATLRNSIHQVVVNVTVEG